MKGAGYQFSDPIDITAITGVNNGIIRPHTDKTKEEKEKRTRDKAEVFTPSWVCNAQNNLIDNNWFGIENVFNKESFENGIHHWHSSKDKISFQRGKTWQDYVCENRMEIACGEAPYLVSRNDSTTGDPIQISQRIGLLDRKLRVVNENVDTPEEWCLWAIAALKSAYGFEWQGDNLLLAREALLYTFVDFFNEFTAKGDFKDARLDNKTLKLAAHIISWNIFQMDGVNMVLPTACHDSLDNTYQLIAKWDKSLLTPMQQPIETTECRSLPGFNAQDFASHDRLSEKAVSSRHFAINAIVGNPPYQLEGASGGNNDAPIYQTFSSNANNLASDYASVILPSRWFAAGRENLLGKYRNEMLTCGHIKTLITYADGKDLFPNVEIKGGICYYLYNRHHSGACDYSFIKNGLTENIAMDLSDFDILIREPMLSKIVKKVTDKARKANMGFVDSIISNDTPFGIPSNPRTSKKTPFCVYASKSDKHDVLLYHIEKQKRKVEYAALADIKKNAKDIDLPKVFVPGTGGSGRDKYVLGKPEFAPSHSVCSQSYLYSVFETDEQAVNFYKYLHTKFLRILVSAMKITQSAPQRVYRFAPLQNFGNDSDIDWTQSITDIDKQLYAKYGLDRINGAIDYIESSLKHI